MIPRYSTQAIFTKFPSAAIRKITICKQQQAIWIKSRLKQIYHQNNLGLIFFDLLVNDLVLEMSNDVKSDDFQYSKMVSTKKFNFGKWTLNW